MDKSQTDKLGFFKRRIVKKYFNAGLDFGDAVSYYYMGECIGFQKLFNKWQKYEKKYAALGFKTIPLDDFVSGGGYGVEIDNLLYVKLQANEQPVYHADEFDSERPNFATG